MLLDNVTPKRSASFIISDAGSIKLLPLPAVDAHAALLIFLFCSNLGGNVIFFLGIFFFIFFF